jgi:hypothetical protein
MFLHRLYKIYSSIRVSGISLRPPGISFRTNRADSEKSIAHHMDLSYSETIEELDMQ